MTELLSEKNVLTKCIEYFNGDELAATTWMRKYCLKNKKGEMMEETPRDMHIRLANQFARIENMYPNPLSFEEIFDLFDHFKYVVPQGRPMAGIGNEYQTTSISNCFFGGTVNDSYASILSHDAMIAQIGKRGGGMGLNISKLRPSGSPTSNSSNGIAGCTQFMERYSYTTGEVTQSGRRGALMILLSVDHPDVKKFITKKMDKKSVTNANISVALTDKFMNAVKNKGDFDLVFNGKVFSTVKAKEIYDLIVHCATKSAEPGVVFWDTIKTSPADSYEEFETEGTNPCAEISLSPLDSCRLMLMNLYEHVNNPFTSKASFNYDKFTKHVYMAQRLMDDMVDLEIEKIDQILDTVRNSNDPEEDKVFEIDLWSKIKKVGLRGRRTGLGITGEGDMLAALNLTYGTPEATAIAEFTHTAMCLASYKSSIDMAEERGAFPAFDYDKESKGEFMLRVMNLMPVEYLKKYAKYGRRNIANLTIAPAGTVSIMTQTTSGIEPVFLPVYKRRRRTEDASKAAFTDNQGVMFEEFNVFHHHFKTWMGINGYDTNKDYSPEELKGMLEKSPYHKATSNDVDWVEKVRMQGKIQKWIDHSISVTVNMPRGTSEEDVARVYMAAWENKCKGCTIYIDGTLDGVLVSNDTCSKKVLEKHDAPKRPKDLPCDIHIFSQKGEKYLCAVGLMDSIPYEVFVMKYNTEVNCKKGFLKKVSSGVYALVDENKNVVIPDLSNLMVDEIEDFTRMISFGLRHSGSIKFAVEQLQKSKGNLTSFAKVMARTLKRYIKDGESSSSKCPECGDGLKFSDGCLMCPSCGYSKCS